MEIEVTAIAIENGEEHEFYFYMPEKSTKKEILNKAFEIAYCKYLGLNGVKIVDIQK